VSKGQKKRTVVKRSKIHGRGLYAGRDLPKGEELIEYRGKIITWDEAQEKYESDDESEEGLTYFFDLGDGRVIDGADGGNGARFINHGCKPNCEAIDHDGRIWIHTLRKIKAGEEFLIDYSLIVDDSLDEDERAVYACRCGAKKCRGTMLSDG
jgi:SET domain-containing protein